MLTTFKRIIDFAIKDFLRNKGISIAAIFVLTITILLVTSLYFFGGITTYLTKELQNQIDISAYFKADTSEQDILNVKDQIVKMSPNIKSIEYVSKDQALASFNQSHKNNEVLARALAEVGDNPFLPSLNIATNGDPSQYEAIANVLQTSDFSKLIDKVDYSEKKNTIEKVYSISKNINIFGFILSAVLVFLAILVVFNTIRLAIENSKNEISTMRIVGASDSFIRGPFIIQGVIYGVISFFISIILSGLAALALSSKMSVILPGFNTFSFFLINLWILVLIQLGFGIAVGAISAYFVVRKYLKV